MNKEFGRIITNLRKKKGLTQKDAATELGISQALLSHYEKGIRECGLSFLVRLADFYDVTTDYLLGRTPSSSASGSGIEEIPEAENLPDINRGRTNTYCLLNKKLISISTGIIYTLLSEINNKKLSKQVSEYLSVANYNVFRKIYSLRSENSEEMFGIQSSSADHYCCAALELENARIDEIRDNRSIDGIELSADILSEKFSDSYTSLHQLIKNSEKVLIQNFKL
jgi:transcriptional regulator with XRE-family HTH domain